MLRPIFTAIEQVVGLEIEEGMHVVGTLHLCFVILLYYHLVVDKEDSPIHVHFLQILSLVTFVLPQSFILVYNHLLFHFFFDLVVLPQVSFSLSFDESFV